MTTESRLALGVCHAIYSCIVFFVSTSAALGFLRRSGWVMAVYGMITGTDVDASFTARAAIAAGILGVGVILALPSVVASAGLFTDSRWTRPWALTAATISFPVFPFGTGLSVLTLWFMLAPPRTSVEYRVSSSTSDTFR